MSHYMAWNEHRARYLTWYRNTPPYENSADRHFDFRFRQISIPDLLKGLNKYHRQKRNILPYSTLCHFEYRLRSTRGKFELNCKYVADIQYSSHLCQDLYTWSSELRLPAGFKASNCSFSVRQRFFKHVLRRRNIWERKLKCLVTCMLIFGV